MTRTTEQTLADQQRQAYAVRELLFAAPMPSGLCPRHADQHRRWGWHDSHRCTACKHPKRQNTTEECEA
jgi:hypothetical protein